MKTAVVILNWNGKKLLEQFLPSVVLHSTALAEIYVIDNASTDDSVVFIEQQYPSITIIKNTQNFGYAMGYNEGLKQIEADVFILLNSDVEVTPGWIEPILNEFKKNNQLAAAQPKILDYKKRAFFEYAGAAGGFIDKYGYPYCRGRIFNTLEKDEGQYDGVSEIFWASGACLFVKKDIFWNVGGFDHDYFAHQEEIDLCWRIFNHNFKIACVGTSKVYHLGGGTLKNTNAHKTFLNFRNSLFNVLKNCPKGKVAPRLFVRLLLDALAGIHFISNLKIIHFFAILKSHFSFYSKLIKMSEKRLEITKKESYYTQKSIVYLYFVKRIKKFSQL